MMEKKRKEHAVKSYFDFVTDFIFKDNWFLSPAHIKKVMGEVEKIGRYFKGEVARMNGIDG